MKAITLQPYWATAVLDGAKTVEFRTWKTKHRGELLICAGAQREKGCVYGHAVLSVILSDVVPFTKDHLSAAFFDEMPDRPGYAWIFEDPAVIRPIPVKGKPGLFDVDDSLIQYLTTETSDEEVCAIFDAITA